MLTGIRPLPPTPLVRVRGRGTDMDRVKGKDRDRATPDRVVPVCGDKRINPVPSSKFHVEDQLEC